MTLTEQQEQIVGKAVEEAFNHWTPKPSEKDIQATASLVRDYLTKHL